MRIKHYLPNALTLCNLLSGCIALLFAVYNHHVIAAFFVFLGVFFDFFDGFLARKLSVQSALGVQLDSLADLVTSGVVPGVVMFNLMNLSLGFTTHSFFSNSWQYSDFNLVDSINISTILPFLGLSITLASAYRLAKFNIDNDQQTYFKGLPVPANTLLIISLPLILEFQNSHFINNIILNFWFLIGLTLLSCYLLNSKIKLIALKFKDWSVKSNIIKYIFLIISLLLLIIFQFVAIPLIILLYILLSFMISVR